MDEIVSKLDIIMISVQLTLVFVLFTALEVIQRKKIEAGYLVLREIILKKFTVFTILISVSLLFVLLGLYRSAITSILFYILMIQVSDMDEDADIEER